MKKKYVLSSALALLLFVATGAHAATYTLYTNSTNYFTWAGTPIVESFDDATLVSGLSITEVGGAGTIHFGVYQNIVDDSPLRYQVYNYASPMWAFGGWFDLYSPGGPGKSIDVWVDGTKVMNIPNTSNGDFYGFRSDTPFSSVEFRAGSASGSQETYYSIDLAFKPVPIPGAAILLGSGLAGLGLFGRRKKT